MTTKPSPGGVIHDIGYQRYTGPRLGRWYALRSLYTHGIRAAFGLSRSGKAKAFPWAIVGIVTFVAAVMVVIRTQTGQPVGTYWEFPSDLSLLIVFFCAAVAPELVSRDLRSGALSLYFSRPLTRADYALAKLAAAISAVWLLLAGPQTLMFAGGAFSQDSITAVWHELDDYAKGLGSSAVYAVTFGSLSLLVASLAGRRAVSAAAVVAVFLVTTPVYGVLVNLSADDPTSRAARTAGLVSPMTLVNGIGDWLFGDLDDIGPYGPWYGGVGLAVLVASALLLLLRYRRVAR